MTMHRNGRLESGGIDRGVGRRATGNPAGARAGAIQSWRAWSGCGDGAQLHLVIDAAAGKVWLLPAGESPMRARSIE